MKAYFPESKLFFKQSHYTSMHKLILYNYFPYINKHKSDLKIIYLKM